VIEEEKVLTPLEALRAQRKARQDGLKKQEEDQTLIDLTALDALEVELGDSNVAFLTVPFQPGLPTMMIARKPTKAELQRYRAQVKVKPQGNGKQPDSDKTPTEACEIIADSCIQYPEAEVYGRLCIERPGAKAQLGALALKLIVDTESEDAKK
jgi:hypothetical protein